MADIYIIMIALFVGMIIGSIITFIFCQRDLNDLRERIYNIGKEEKSPSPEDSIQRKFGKRKIL